VCQSREAMSTSTAKRHSVELVRVAEIISTAIIAAAPSSGAREWARLSRLNRKLGTLCPHQDTEGFQADRALELKLQIALVAYSITFETSLLLHAAATLLTKVNLFPKMGKQT
jgi:hypothetical protein